MTADDVLTALTRTRLGGLDVEYVKEMRDGTEWFVLYDIRTGKQVIEYVRDRSGRLALVNTYGNLQTATLKLP